MRTYKLTPSRVKPLKIVFNLPIRTGVAGAFPSAPPFFSGLLGEAQLGWRNIKPAFYGHHF
jgi:hypothetical protein